MQKIPYQIVVGDKEVENNQVNVRKYGSQDQDPFFHYGHQFLHVHLVILIHLVNF
jgi:threonyl-tRNA synthetase